ncbi:hypothetical protein PHLCEN_2v13535 [Hermanssonia centrifuga]|uniref:Uncharacterized protein n=1 Tax=Hermanssonia centrifuga TaxID=98765 RepID=A0A2R6NDZ4_9APHY|nr:hypothetical protein PHLCEN_2v13535 [Hermanssonia centrifuga]
MDTGSSSGEIIGHSKTIKTHTKYVQDVKYAPSGDHFASVGSDAKVFLYDGKTGDTLGDVESKKAVTTWTLGSGVNNQQVGNVWTEGDDIVSLSMSGDLNIFDKRTGDKPARVLQGPSKPITAAVQASSSGTFIEGVADGRVLAHSGSEYSYLDGPGHTNLVSGIAVASDGKVFSAGYDDTVREITPDVSGFIIPPHSQSSFSTASQPKSLAVAGDSTVFVTEVNAVEAIRSNQKVYDFQPKFTPSAVAASGSVVAVGGEMVNSRWSNHSGRVLSLAWSADGKHCASGSLDTHVYVWSIAKPMKNIAIKNAAAGSVNAVFWLGETKLGSAGADGCVRTWDITFHA